MKNYSILIKGSGSCIPDRIIPNSEFETGEFYSSSGEKIQDPPETTIRKFEKITGIKERRWLENSQVTSDLGTIAAEKAIRMAGIDPEKIGYILCAQNFGDIKAGSNRADLIPSVASRIKHNLGIRNPYCFAFDINFGCPAWILGLSLAKTWLDSQQEETYALVIGVETLSRVIDPFDRDRMIFSDGAGAVILEKAETGTQRFGILAELTRTDTADHNLLLKMGKSNNPNADPEDLFVKMEGPKLYEYALNLVPPSIFQVVNKAGLKLEDIRMVLIHQANEKMIDAMIKRLFQLNQNQQTPPDFVPKVLSWLGNNAVASVPTLFDLINRKKLEGFSFMPGDKIVFAAVGSGMSISALVYQIPE